MLLVMRVLSIVPLSFKVRVAPLPSPEASWLMTSCSKTAVYFPPDKTAPHYFASVVTSRNHGLRHCHESSSSSIRSCDLSHGRSARCSRSRR